jgi:hypothetical protein
VNYVIENQFATDVDAFLKVLDDPGLYPRLESSMPGLQRIEPLERTEDEREIRRRVRYTPRVEGKIPSFGRALVRPEMLSWVEESTLDKSARRIAYRILPNLPEAWRERFESRGTYDVVPSGRGILRRIAGEVHVRVPIFGRTVEKMLIKEVEENFRAEAGTLAQMIAERR